MFISTNPATEVEIGRYPFMTDAETEAMLHQAVRAQAAWAMRTLDERCTVIKRLGEILISQADAIAPMITREMGKPLAQSRAEVLKCATVCTYYAEHAEHLLAEELIDTEFAQSGVRYDPLGLVLSIMPWNFPLWQFFRFAVPALLAGNGVVLKHAPTTWGCAFEAVRCCREAGIPEELVCCLLADVPQVANVIADRRIRAVTFTGSTRGGAAVAAAAGAAVKKCVMELGGSDAYMVLEDADVEHAARICVASRTTNSGQSCVAAKRFIVHQAVRNAFTDYVIDGMLSLTVGDPFDAATQIGPLARRDLRDGLLEQVRASVADGAVAHGGASIDGPGWFVAPTVLTNVMPTNPAFTEELFGPVAAIIEATDDDHALQLANASRYGLGSAVFTRSEERATRFVRGVEAGMVVVNDMVRSDARLPFGGVKDSGFGRELGPLGIREFVNAKTFARR